MSNNIVINWSQVAAELRDVLRDSLSGVLEGANSDLTNYFNDIAQDLTRAMRRGDSKLTEEIKAQALALLEINRIRVVGAQSRVFDAILNTAIRVASAILLGAITTL